MRFEYVILLIVAFNVVTGILQQRAKKKRAEQARAAASRPRDAAEDPVSPRAEEAGDEAPAMPSLGRDILDQIARDLGLKVPVPAPAPEPRRAERPAPAAPAAAPREAEIRTREAGDRSREPAAAVAASRPATAPRRSAVREEPAPAKIPAFSIANLKNPATLREALVLKEILDAPVSRRRGR